MPDSSEYTIRSSPHQVCQTATYRLQILNISNTAIIRLLNLENFPIAAIDCLDRDYQIRRYSSYFWGAVGPRYPAIVCYYTDGQLPIACGIRTPHITPEMLYLNAPDPIKACRSDCLEML